MKKKLREEIKSLAKKITSEENKFNTRNIKSLTKELYEKLIVLEYLEMQIGEHSEEQHDSLDSKSFREENWFSEPVPVPQPEHKEDLVEPLMEKIKDIVAQMPEESDEIDEKLEQIFSKNQFESFNVSEHEREVPEQKRMSENNVSPDNYELQHSEEHSEKHSENDQEQIDAEEQPRQEDRENVDLPELKNENMVTEDYESQPVIEEEKEQNKKTFPRNELEEFASSYQQTPIFERKTISSNPETKISEPNEEESSENKIAQGHLSVKRIKSLNDSVNKGLNIALNDRLTFIKHLFEGKSEDYTRVLSQINTMNSYEEAASFIRDQVKPDYNNWSNKEEYSQRFMIIVEKRFD